MLQALRRTITEILDSKKAAYSFIGTGLLCLLHLYFNIPVQDALMLISPLGLATAAQAHVDAATAKKPVPVAVHAPTAPTPVLVPGAGTA